MNSKVYISALSPTGLGDSAGQAGVDLHCQRQGIENWWILPIMTPAAPDIRGGFAFSDLFALWDEAGLFPRRIVTSGYVGPEWLAEYLWRRHGRRVDAASLSEIVDTDHAMPARAELRARLSFLADGDSPAALVIKPFSNAHSGGQYKTAPREAMLLAVREALHFCNNPVLLGHVSEADALAEWGRILNADGIRHSVRTVQTIRECVAAVVNAGAVACVETGLGILAPQLGVKTWYICEPGSAANQAAPAFLRSFPELCCR